MIDSTWTDNDFCTVCTQQAPFLLAGLIRHHKDTVIAFKRSRYRQPMASIATGWFDNRPTGAQPSLFLTVRNQARPYTILDTSSRIKHLHFRQHKGLNIAGHTVEAQEWRIPYLLQDTVKIAHLLCSRFCCLFHEKNTFFLYQEIDILIPIV